MYVFYGCVGLLSILFYFFWIRWNSKRSTSSKMIPGWNKKPSDPVLGDLAVAMSAGSLHHYLAKQHKEGSSPVVSFWWRSKRVVSICSQKSFKDTENIYNRPAVIFAPCFDPLHGPNSIQSVNGEEWKRQGKMLRGTMRGDFLESFVPDLVLIACETAKRWGSGEPIHLLKSITRMTLKAILVTSLGNIFENDEGIDELAALYHVCKCEMDERVLDVPPPQSQREKDFQSNLKILQGHLKQMIKACQGNLQNGRKPLPLMDALINSGDPEETVMSNVITFMGGFHTSGYFLTWTFYYLALHPEIQDKIMEEIIRKVGKEASGEKLKEYVMSSDSYLRQFLDEAIRMSTPTSFSAHCPDKDVVVDDYHIPANTPIIHSLGVAMHDPNVWENPQKFDPDRFGPGSKHAKRGHEFRPFGVSSLRRCPANHFTYIMSSIYVVILLQRFEFSTKDTSLTKKYGIATSPGHEIDFQVKTRE